MKGPASMLFDLAARIGPAKRGVWFEAMRTEIEFMHPAQRLRFASGCLGAAVVWRVWTPEGVLRTAQGLLTAACGSLAALVIAHGLFGAFGDLSLVVIALGVTYAAGAIVTARWGPRAMIVFALSGIGVNGLVQMASFRGIVEPGDFALALSVEACLILTLFLGVSALTLATAKHLERSA